jgi:hypothetical protein
MTPPIFTSSSELQHLVTMLILETHKDVATKADGKEGSMSENSCDKLNGLS